MTRPAVLVTGGAQRIGAAIVRAFAANGWQVVIHCHRARAAAEALARTLPDAQVVACDLADQAASAAMIADLAARLPEWRCLVANAAIFPEDRPLAPDPAVFAAAMAVNALAPARLAADFLTQARSSAGRRVIWLTDQKLASLNPDFASYTMSKAAADAGARMLAMAAAPEDRIYRLAPGAILASHDQTEAEAERSHRLNLLARRTGAEEVAAAALFLATGPLASGEQLIVDSGQHLLAQARDVIYLARKEATR